MSRPYRMSARKKIAKTAKSTKTAKKRATLSRESSIVLVDPNSTRVRGMTDRTFYFKQRVSGEALTLVSSALGSAGAGPNKYLIQSASAERDWACAFCLNDLDQVATFQALFDSYKIVKVELNFRPLLHENVLATIPLAGGYTGTTTTLDAGTIILAVDKNDYTVNTYAQLRQLPDSMVARVIQPKDIKVTVANPLLSTAVYAAGAFSSYASAQPWVDTASPAAQYFGVKVAIDQGNASAVIQAWAIDAMYHIVFKGVK